MVSFKKIAVGFGVVAVASLQGCASSKKTNDEGQTSLRRSEVKKDKVGQTDLIVDQIDKAQKEATIKAENEAVPEAVAETAKDAAVDKTADSEKKATIKAENEAVPEVVAGTTNDAAVDKTDDKTKSGCCGWLNCGWCKGADSEKKATIKAENEAVPEVVAGTTNDAAVDKTDDKTKSGGWFPSLNCCCGNKKVETNDVPKEPTVEAEAGRCCC